MARIIFFWTQAFCRQLKVQDCASIRRLRHDWQSCTKAGWMRTCRKLMIHCHMGAYSWRRRRKCHVRGGMAPQRCCGCHRCTSKCRCMLLGTLPCSRAEDKCLLGTSQALLANVSCGCRCEACSRCQGLAGCVADPEALREVSDAAMQHSCQTASERPRHSVPHRSM